MKENCQSSTWTQATYMLKHFLPNFMSLLSMGSKQPRKESSCPRYTLEQGMEKRNCELTKRVKESPQLQVDVLLDANRGTRGSPDSVAMLLDAVQHSNCRGWFYQTPDMTPLLKKTLKPPFNETVGLQHTKIFVFDDTLLLTGANLSEDYFGQRQDRYIVIKDAQAAEWYAQTVELFCTISHKLGRDGSLLETQYDPSDREEFRVRATAHVDSICDERQSNTSVYPLLQLGLFGIHTKEDTLCDIFQSLESDGHVDIASGYFNLSPRLKREVLSTQSSVSIVCASPNANGFLGAKGVKGHIPFGYSHFLMKFLKDLPEERDVDVCEYDRAGWTFHAKGVWVRNNRNEPPFATIVGSSNFNHRSAERDLEAQALIVTSDKSLQYQLEQEVQGIKKFSHEVHEQDLSREDRKPTTGQRVAAELISSFL
eukprot:m.9949 g.9949  ORF g.9949 m.9949 type:complete len:426 (-) comp6469_c0_seq2:92-1369(-)